ncbi:MAG: hypothetical protein ACRC3K_06220 [Plesiomonas sp.]
MTKTNYSKKLEPRQLKCLPVRGGSKGGYTYVAVLAGERCTVNSAFAAWLMNQGAV